jgi:hypothetical protein
LSSADTVLTTKGARGIPRGLSSIVCGAFDIVDGGVNVVARWSSMSSVRWKCSEYHGKRGRRVERPRGRLHKQQAICPKRVAAADRPRRDSVRSKELSLVLYSPQDLQ